MDRNDKSWIKVGAKVAIIATGGWHHRIDGTSTIVKIGKRDIVLANGRRFRMSDLTEQGQTYRGDLLLSSSDPKVAEIREEEAQRDRMNKARGAVEAWGRAEQYREDPLTILMAIRALARLLPEDQPSKSGILKAVERTEAL